VAGTYADVPGPRIPYDRANFNAIMVSTSGGQVWSAGFPQSERIIFNNESDDFVVVGSGNQPVLVSFVLPELYNISGYAIRATSSQTPTGGILSTSTDTTDGYDGTWTQREANSTTVVGSRGGVRSVKAVDWTGVKGVRLQFQATVFANPQLHVFHLYGTPVTPTNRLRFWHPTLDQAVTGAYFDFGDVAAGQTYVRQFRLKNTTPGSSGITDDFNRTDSAGLGSTPVGDKAYTYGLGGAVTATPQAHVVSNRAVMQGADSKAMLDLANASDFTFEVTVAGIGQGAGVAFRYPAGTVSSGYVYVFSDRSLFSQTNSGYSLHAANGPTFVAGQRARISRNGSIIIIQNLSTGGEQAWELTHEPAGTCVGIRGDGPGATFDDLSVTQVSAGAASTVTVVREVLTDLNPTTIGEYSFSLDGTAWTSSLTLTSIAHGAISPVLRVRRVVGASAAVGPVQARIVASAATWT
jgi:hypothetical protein